jgi:hypothetical protein
MSNSSDSDNDINSQNKFFLQNKKINSIRNTDSDNDLGSPKKYTSTDIQILIERLENKIEKIQYKFDDETLKLTTENRKLKDAFLKLDRINKELELKNKNIHYLYNLLHFTCIGTVGFFMYNDYLIFNIKI